MRLAALVGGHRATVCDRDKHGRPGGLGKTVVIAVQDDHTRLVYAELHSAENAANVSITLRRGAAWMREQGLGPVQAVISDYAKCYTGHRFQATLDELGARHIRIPPYTPRWNGKLERFFAPSKTNGPTAASGPTQPRATAPCHRSCATSTAGAHTPPPAARPRITRVQQDRRQDN